MPHVRLILRGSYRLGLNIPVPTRFDYGIVFLSSLAPIALGALVRVRTSARTVDLIRPGGGLYYLGFLGTHGNNGAPGSGALIFGERFLIVPRLMPPSALMFIVPGW